MLICIASRFISASKVGGKGFQIAWTAVSHPEYVETEEGLIGKKNTHHITNAFHSLVVDNNYRHF